MVTPTRPIPPKKPTEVWELGIRAVVRGDTTTIELRNYMSGPAPEPIVLQARMTKQQVLAYLSTTAALGV